MSSPLRRSRPLELCQQGAYTRPALPSDTATPTCRQCVGTWVSCLWTMHQTSQPPVVRPKWRYTRTSFTLSPQNHTQPTRQPTCNIITGGLSPFNSPQSPRLSPFNSPQSPKPAAPNPVSCSSRQSAIVTALYLAATAGLQWYAVSHFSPPSLP